MHKMLINKILESHKSEDMENLKELIFDMFDTIKMYDYDEYKDMELELYKMIYGEHLNEDLARKWVSNMENKNGTRGEHWSVEQTDQYAGSHNRWEWYACMNMMFSDYYNPKFNTDDYITMANNWISDKDVPSGKTLRYYFYVVCAK